MRLVAACLALAVFCAGSFAASNVTTNFTAPDASLTIVLSFTGPYSSVSVAEMKRELGSVLEGSGLRVNWRLREEVNGESFADLILVKFKGKCMMEAVPFENDSSGPLAFTRTSGRAILPYREVECDNVRRLIRSAMWGGDYTRGDLLMGRALGRVLAHEIYHIKGQTSAHASGGLAQPALSGSALISDRLRLRPEDVHALQVGLQRDAEGTSLPDR